ncbi:MAG: hypothetical protein JSV49_07445 [Thermoplasmata archaeon]|nr:MAG: hypothetical protein JSV49_07445 [Thermoplasmata archaeon]
MNNFLKTNDSVKHVLKLILAVIIIILIIASAIQISSAGSSEEATTSARTGNLGNQPAGGFSEGDDIFEIYHWDNSHDTSFSIGETVYVRLSTTRVQDFQGTNELIVRSYDDTKVIDMDPAFTQVSTSPPYVYESSFTAPSTADHYLVEANIEDDNGNIFRTYDVIIVGDGSSPMKYIRTYSDAEYTNLASTFVSYGIVYVEVFQNEVPSEGNSKVDIRDYKDNKETRNIRTLQNPLITRYQNNYARFAIDLGNDFSWSLQDGYWYIISTDIRNDAGTDICKRWSVQIYIKRPPGVSSGITDVNSPVDVVGANQVTISSQFTNPDLLSVSSFEVSFKLRAPDDSTEILLINQKTSGGAGELGGALSVTFNSANNIYTASYSFDPAETWVLGNYDLYFSVSNNYGESIDGFGNNANELNLINSLIQPPEIAVGVTKCIPSSVDIYGTATVTIYSEFTDTGNPDVSAFIVTFKIKQGGQPEIILVRDKANGGLGEFGGTVSIAYSGGIYTASYTWDPDASFQVGTYDLYFEVDDGVSGSVQDDFQDNQDELTLINSDNIPSITVGSTFALPSSVDKMGDGIVTIYSEFSDADLPDSTSFKVTFKVRDPSNNEIVLVDRQSKGGLSEFGNIVSVDFSGTVYTASVTWNPDETVLTGWYDLYFEVEDANGNSAEDGFDDNEDELEIISLISPPEIDDTTCIPTSVSRVGSGTTTIYTTFTDSNYQELTDFFVTFQVRAPDDTIYILTTNAGNGDVGEYGSLVSISFSGTVYTASYAWNPPDDISLGDYDLYSTIRNSGGGIAVDDFGDNEDELTIETTENPPEIIDTQCIPSSLTVKGNVKTQLFVSFTDNDNPPIGDLMITFKVRDEDNNEITIITDKSSGLKSPSGEILNLSFSGTEYTASILWDPPEDTYSGKYDLYSSVFEKNGALIEHDFDQNEDELTLTDGPIIGEPLLQESYTFDSATGEFNFTVTYTDSDNDAPNDDGVILKIGSDTYEMKETDPDDQDYTDGKDYYYELKLDDGRYTYGFEVTNTDDEVYETGEEPLTVGPDDKSSKPSGSGSALAILLIIVVAIIVVLVLLMVLKKKKKPTMNENVPVRAPPPIVTEPQTQKPAEETQKEPEVAEAAEVAKPEEKNELSVI